MSSNETLSFVEIIKSVKHEDALATAHHFTSECDARAEYEKTKNVDNTSIQKHIASARKSFAKLSVAGFLIASETRKSFVNEAERVNARRNIYAVQKLTALAESVALGSAHNAVNLHVLRSLFKCAKANVEFSHKLALAATSDKIVVDAPLRKHLSRHTVSAETASTQASSTMNALLAAHVVREYRNEANDLCYALNDNALVTHLRAALA